MMRRVLSLLLLMVFAAQTLVVYAAPAAPEQAAHPCHDASQVHDHAQQQEPPQHLKCPHCQDMATAGAGCAGHCTAALIASSLPVLDRAAHLQLDHSAALSFLTRSDVPPTPPPITLT